MSDPSATARLSAHAQRLLDETRREAAREAISALNDEARLALALELRDFSLSTWTSEPMRCKDASLALDWLAKLAQSEHISALANWARTVAHLSDGDMQSAVFASESAESWFLKEHDRVSAARVAIPRVMALAQLGRVEEAEQCARQALSVFVEVRDLFSAGKVELNLGSLSLQQDRYDEAVRFYRSASVRFARAREIEYSIFADIGQADALTEQMKFDEALALYERANARAVARGAHTSVAHVRQSLGLLERYRGNLAQSLRWLQQACSDYEREADDRMRVECERDLADAYVEAGLLVEADRLYRSVIDALEHVGSKVEQAWAILQRGRVANALSSFTLAAELAQAARLRFAALGNDHGIAHASLLVAEIALSVGELDEAERALDGLADYCRRANQSDVSVAYELLLSRLYVKRGLLESAELAAIQARAVAEQIRHGAMLGRAEIQYGEIAELLGKKDAAQCAYERAASLFEQQHALLQCEELRQGYRALGQRAFDRLISFAVETREPSRVIAAMGRGRAYAQSVSNVADDSPRWRVNSAESTSGLKAQLNWAYRELNLLVENQESTDELREKIRVLEESLVSLTRRSRIELEPGSQRPTQAFEPVTHTGVAESLADGELLVEFYTVGTELFVCAISQDASDVVSIDAGVAAALVNQVRFQIDSMKGNANPLLLHGPTLEKRVRHRLAALGQLLFDRFAPLMQTSTRLLIVPHGVLHYVPFAALECNGRALIDDYEIVVLPTSGMLSQTANNGGLPPVTEGRALVVGALSERLPYVAAETQTLADLLPRATLALGEDATVENVTAAMPHADLIHLACHGQFRADNPYFSALHLVDGAITVYDLSQRQLKARLVVLSACETGVSQRSPGEELLGLTRAFAQAGVAQVVNSLWAVDDRATAALMASFYRHLAAGKSAAQALRLAQLDIKTAGEAWFHPYYWSGFVLSGHTG